MVPKEGHCYLMFKSTSRDRVIAVFNVKKFIRNKLVEINEIEVFNRSINITLNPKEHFIY